MNFLPHIPFLKTVLPFQKLAEENLCELLAASFIKRYEKGQMVILHGDKAEHFFIVLEGWVKLFRETIDGQELVTGLMTKGDCFGEAVVLAEAHYPSCAQVIDAATILLVPGHVVRAKLLEGGIFVENMLRFISQHKMRMELHLEHLTSMNAPQRIGYFLLKLCKDKEEGEVTLKLPYDKALIAAVLGMKPETFSRALAQLKEVGVEVKGPQVRIHDIESLMDYSCISCSYTEEYFGSA